MGLPIIVEIAIGLAFIYLILSLLASEIQELIATVLQWRAKHLKDSIINLFTGDVHSTHSVQKAQQLTKQVYQHPLVQGINQESRGLLPNFFRGITWVISSIYQFIAGKKEGEFNDQRTAPSYISREAFATSLLEQLGTKHFVERLVDAKFSRFIDLIKGKLEITLDLSKKDLGEYKILTDKFKEIEDEFIDKKIDLESAINGISQKLDIFLRQLRQSTSIDQNISNELQEWKLRFFVEEIRKSDTETEQIIKNTEQIIKNFGLSPNLQEIVESIDKGSKVYNTYKEKFQRYEQNRLESVHGDLTLFENFLSGFLKGMVKEFYDKKQKDFLQQWLSEIKTLDTEFFERVGNGPQKTFKRNKRPLSEIDEIILEKLDECLTGINSPEAQNGAEQKLKSSLQAFKEGFTGKTYRFSPRHLFVFRTSLFTKTLSFGLFLLLGFLIFAGLSNLSLLGSLSIKLQTILLSRSGGSTFLILLVLAPILLYRALKEFFSWRKRAKKKTGASKVKGLASEPKKSLAGIFDDYFASDEFSNDNDDGNSLSVPVNTSQAGAQTEAEALQEQETKFSQEISQRLREISEDRVDLYSEMKDLGRSFRRYYLRFLLENADIDLAFIPSSVKQSLAVLIRRSKTSAKQAEDQIIHLKEEVEAWYDRSMDRASGVYKRNAKGISILIGIVLAIALNANSIHILDQLAFEQELRETVVQSAEKLAKQVVVTSGELSDKNQSKLYRETSELLDDMNLPIGWDPDLIDKEFNCGLTGKVNKTSNPSGTQSAESPGQVNLAGNDWNTLFQTCLYEKEIANQTPEEIFPPTAIAAILLAHPLVGLKFLLGWILTGLAISMGASFWFDLLSKLVKVRNTGKQLSNTSASDAQDATQ